MAYRRYQCCVGEADLDMHIGSAGKHQSLFRMVMESVEITTVVRDIGVARCDRRLQSFGGNRYRQAVNAHGQQNQPPQSHRIG